MNRKRMEGRIQRLLDARAKCEAKLKAYPKHPRAATWKRKKAEYDVSLANFQKYGQEEKPNGKPIGVQIDVPAGTFKITEHAPLEG
jgi:hypothetical protein